MESIISTSISKEGREVAMSELRDIITGLTKHKDLFDRNMSNGGLLESISAYQAGARKGNRDTVLLWLSSRSESCNWTSAEKCGNVQQGLTSCACLLGVLRYEIKYPSEHWVAQRQNGVLNVLNEDLSWVNHLLVMCWRDFTEGLVLPTRLSEVRAKSEKTMRHIAGKSLTDV